MTIVIVLVVAVALILYIQQELIYGIPRSEKKF
jgi:hypothetical protein